MNVVDALLAAALLVAAIGGFRSGFIASTYGLVSWLAALLGALILTVPVADRVAPLVVWPGPFVRAGLFVLLALGFELLFGLAGQVVVTPLRRAAHRLAPLAGLDRVLGVLPATVRTLLIAALVLAALPLLPVDPAVRAAAASSRAAQVLVAQISIVEPLLDRLVGDREGGEIVVTRLSADDRQPLDLPPDLDLVPDPESEGLIVQLVNGERARVGLAVLAIDPRLVDVARGHSTEMFRLRYFAHVSPVTGTPFDRLTAAGIAYSRAGENLAYARSVAHAHRGLMDSPGHRANILRPEFTRIGVGVISAGVHGRMFTQLFLTTP